MRIRAARPEEYAAVGELTARVYVEDGFVPTDFPYVVTLRDAATRAEQAELLVALDDGGRLLGSVTFAFAGSPYAELAKGPDEAAFRMLVVEPAARGRGVGEALVRECVRIARTQHARVLRLSTQSEMHTAHRLYERLGFVRTPDLDWSPVPGVDLLTYAKDLGDPTRPGR